MDSASRTRKYAKNCPICHLRSYLGRHHLACRESPFSIGKVLCETCRLAVLVLTAECQGDHRCRSKDFAWRRGSPSVRTGAMLLGIGQAAGTLAKHPLPISRIDAFHVIKGFHVPLQVNGGLNLPFTLVFQVNLDRQTVQHPSQCQPDAFVGNYRPGWHRMSWRIITAPHRPFWIRASAVLRQTAIRPLIAVNCVIAVSIDFLIKTMFVFAH